MARLPCPTRDLILSASNAEDLNFYRNGMFAYIIEELKHEPCMLNNDTRLFLLDMFMRLQNAKLSELSKILLFTKGGRYQKSYFDKMAIGELINTLINKYCRNPGNISDSIAKIMKKMPSFEKSNDGEKVHFCVQYKELGIDKLKQRRIHQIHSEWQEYDEWKKRAEVHLERTEEVLQKR